MNREHRTKSELLALRDDALMSFTEVGTLYSTSRQRIEQAVNDGRLAATQVGPYWLVQKKDARRYLEHPPSRGWPKGKPRKYEETQEKIFTD